MEPMKFIPPKDSDTDFNAEQEQRDYDRIFGTDSDDNYFDMHDEDLFEKETWEDDL